jgi:hypothetical protein
MRSHVQRPWHVQACPMINCYLASAIRSSLPRNADSLLVSHASTRPSELPWKETRHAVLNVARRESVKHTESHLYTGPARKR